MKKHDPLTKLASKTGLFISLYMPVDRTWTKKDLTTMIHSHLKDLSHTAHNLKKTEDKYLNALLQKVKDSLENVDTRGAKTVVVFAGRDYWEVLKLPITVPLRVHLDKKPLLAPLTEAYEENPPFIIALIDRDRGKIIEVNFAFEEAKSRVIKSDVPQRILAKGDDMGREDKILRHIEDHLHRHLVKVARELQKFETAYPNGLIVVGAQKELVGKFKNLLSKKFQHKVIGSFGAEVDDNETEVIKKAQKIVDSYLEKKAWGQVS